MTENQDPLNGDAIRCGATGPAVRWRRGDRRPLRQVTATLMLAALGLFSPTLSAQSTPSEIDRANREIERILQEQRERSEREQEEQRARQPRTLIEVPPLPEPPAAGAGPCRDIQRIEIEGAELIDASDQQKLIQQYLGTCMAVGDVERLLSDITGHYFRRGYIGARAYIQTQDLNEGVLKVLVLEGEITSLILDDDDRRSINLGTAFPGTVGHPLNLRDFEQGLDQVNRLASNRATLELQPGESAGETVVVIHNDPSRRFHANLTFDNFGSDSTGRNQGGASLLFDHLARLNDSAMVTHRRTVNSDYSDRHSHTTSLLYSIPFGYWTATASQVFTRYQTTVELVSNSLTASGKSSISSLQVDYVAYRDQVNHVSLDTTLTLKSNDNELAGQRLDVSSRELANADLGVAWRTRLWGGALSSGLNYVRGLALFGAYEDPNDLPNDAPHAQFQKWQSLVTWYKPFKALSRDFTFGTNLNGQWSDEVLYGQDQFLVGSVFSVRGFRQTSLSGDRGFYWRNDLSTRFAVPVRSLALDLRPSLGLDLGRIGAHGNQMAGTLAGGAVGLALSLNTLTADLRAVAPISKPDSFEDEGVQFYFNVSYSL
jgi:hemolysin activation/secretion protein